MSAETIVPRCRALSTGACHRLSLLLPVVVPLLSYPLFRGGWGSVSYLAGWLVMGSMADAADYVPTAIFLLLWMRGKTEREQRHALRWAPVLMAPVLCIHNLLYALGGASGAVVGRGWELLAFYSGCVLVFGYGYVALGFAVLSLLRSTGRVTAEGR